MSQCVYCDETTNLNTQLTITLEDDTKVTVHICDEHAEEASVKTARAAYQEKQAKIEEVMRQAAALGLNVSEGPGQLVIAEKTEAQPQAQPQNQPIIVEATQPDIDDPDWVTTEKVDAAKGMNSVGGNTELGAVAAHSSHVISGQQDILPPETRRGKVRMQLAEGRAGHPLALPAERIDGTGHTRIRIKQTESDPDLQKRFKDMAKDSVEKGVQMSTNGYQSTIRTCPICRGECVVNNQDCPKCGGAGHISVY